MSHSLSLFSSKRAPVRAVQKQPLRVYRDLLLVSGSRLDEGLVPVAKVDHAPASSLRDYRAGTGAISGKPTGADGV
ncbi:unannotated protein [freshwater metagenome]|uniref:Unannotated protein n=1 Tax=freshwater metagenome TaxID=449393 RepID=A0A6J6M6C1_9ZZZZ